MNAKRSTSSYRRKCAFILFYFADIQLVNQCYWDNVFHSFHVMTLYTATASDSVKNISISDTIRVYGEIFFTCHALVCDLDKRLN